MDKGALLEEKVRSLIELMNVSRREADRLRKECETLRSHVEVLSEENTKAQKIFADYKQLRTSHQQAITKVERALSRLTLLHK